MPILAHATLASPPDRQSTLDADLSCWLDAATIRVAPEATGAVTKVVGLRFDVEGLQLPVGAGVRVRNDGHELVGQVVGVDGDRMSCMPFGDLQGIRVGARVHIDHDSITVPAGYALLGRVLNGMGVPIDDGPPLGVIDRVATEGQPPHPLRRARIDTPLSTGVRAWDTLATLGRGQRVGVFAGSGVGKSTLLGMVARNTSADINVVAMIGERGREVREFIESDLGPEGLARSVVIVATSDEPALVRRRAAATATRIAEWFRDRDRHVLLMMDSLTRFCMAQREIGLSAGEPPTTRAYPPSVFALLPGLLERAGTAERGSITGIYTVLVDGDDMNEPISDAVRSILDGHIVLSRRLAHANHYPAIDVLSSVSRVAPAVTTTEQRASAGELRALLAAHAEARDLIEIGAYVSGTNPTVDRAVALRPRIDGFLRQGVEEKSSVAVAFEQLGALVGAPA